ncbi:hypothetical protein DC498_04255 [Terrimonas sp.]|uniref:hypothetical protein n=1 Tax=Terrimonas sp. TaxID=1914338 RepID=UPI000D50E9BC|nr:hypothetical protein [Terrimonas sp.]PVD53731.1 hypothetical protein DC498_04255 [Terrimonas sp.]
MVAIIPPKPEYNRFVIPDSLRKAEQFEKFVLTNLFPPKLYTVIGSAGLKLRDNATGFEFHLVCRHHYSLISNSFTFVANRNNIPVFFVLGLGGSAETPNEVYLANFQDCPYMHLFKRHLKNKAIITNQPVSSAALWKHSPKIEAAEKKIA